MKTIHDESNEKDEISNISSNGKPCIFPFKYDGKSYSACTLVDSDTGIPWCATGKDQDEFVIDNDWGECTENKKTVNEPMIKQIDKQCVFSFK